MSEPRDGTPDERPEGRVPLVTRDFVLLTLGHLLQAMAYSSMLLLPLYLSHLHASRAEIGAVMAAASIGGLCIRPATGWSLDTLGRKPTLYAGTVLAATGMALLLLVDRMGPLVYAVRALFGIGVACMFTGYFTLAADLIPESRRTEGLALFGISGIVPLAMNPLAGEIGVDAPELRWFLPAVGGFVLVSIVCLLPIAEPPRHARGEGPTGLLPALRALGRRRLWPVWLATAVFSGLVAVFFAFATVAAESRGIGRPAALWFAYAGGAVVVRLLGARLPDRIGPANMVAPALACYTGGALLLASATGAEGFLAGGLLAGFGHGYCFPVLTGQVVGRTPPHLRGTGLAVFTGLWDLSALLGPPFFGAFADRFGDSAMFAFSSVVAIAALSAWAALEHRHGEPVGPRALQGS